MMHRVIIYGAGSYGKLAYHYYRSKSIIIGFIDQNEELWGSKVEGITVFGPKDIDKICFDTIVVIAVKHGIDNVQRLLYEQYGIDTTVVFGVTESVSTFIPNETQHTTPQVIIKYSGGVGNQLFQYAFSRCFGDKLVTAWLNDYKGINKRRFVLKDFFPNVEIGDCDEYTRKEYLMGHKKYYSEHELTPDAKCSKALFDIEEGLFEGFWQDYRYPEKCKSLLREELIFKDQKEERIIKLANSVSDHNAVSIHFRRTDYLNEKYFNSLGGICSEEYYERAVSYIKGRVEDPVFYIFSDDTEYAKKMAVHIGGTVIDKFMFEHYEDWYDLYLMSLCSHNIIANSSFSWWGAWLNNNPRKIVIAPKRWHKYKDFSEICPPSWIRM